MEEIASPSFQVPHDFLPNGSSTEEIPPKDLKEPREPPDEGQAQLSLGHGESSQHWVQAGEKDLLWDLDLLHQECQTLPGSPMHLLMAVSKGAEEKAGKFLPHTSEDGLLVHTGNRGVGNRGVSSKRPVSAECRAEEVDREERRAELDQLRGKKKGKSISQTFIIYA